MNFKNITFLVFAIFYTTNHGAAAPSADTASRPASDEYFTKGKRRGKAVALDTKADMLKRYGGEESSNLHLDNIELQDLGGSLDDLAPEVKTYFNKGIILFNGKRYGLGSAVRKGSRATPHDYTWFEFDPSVNEWIYNTEVSLLQNRILLQVLSAKHALEDYLIRLRKDYDKRFDM